MSGKAKTSRARSEARGTPPITLENTLLPIFTKVFDDRGRIWEIAPHDHTARPRQVYLEARAYAAKRGIRAMIEKRDHLVYVQNLDAAAKLDRPDLTVYPLAARETTLKTWLLPTEVTDEQPPDANELPDPTPMAGPRSDAAEAFTRPLAARESSLNIPARQLEPYVLQVMNAHFESSLMNSEILRIVDHLVHEAGTDHRAVHHQQLRQCLIGLVEDDNVLLFARQVTSQERVAMGNGANSGLGGRGMPPAATQVYSPTSPVPTWSIDLHERLLDEYPDPRPPVHAGARPGRQRRTIIEQPTYKVTTSKPAKPAQTDVPIAPEATITLPEPVIAKVAKVNGTDLQSRAQALSQQFSQLLADAAAQGNRNTESLENELAMIKRQLTASEAETVRLKTINDEGVRLVNEMRDERDAAVTKLHAITEAQRALAQLLGNS